VLNQDVREKMKKHNPWALPRIIEVLYEASKRGYWRSDERFLEEIERVRLDVERMSE